MRIYKEYCTCIYYWKFSINACSYLVNDLVFYDRIPYYIIEILITLLTSYIISGR